jgi:hypothetical protein
MQAHQERVVAERSELADKTEKLYTFLRSGVFVGLAGDEQERLVRQYGLMKSYVTVLDERIAKFQ